jgi:sugar/nucleoside kinase (ribokinase family)
MADIVGIGILNIDYIIRKSSVKSIAAIPESGPGGTHHVSPERIMEIIGSVGLDRFQISPGGSSFNTIYAISSMNAGISVGYVGISGKEEHGCDFHRIFTEHAIDDTYVKYDDTKSNGKCISLTGSDRSLLISSPISYDYEEFLNKNKYLIIDYLQKTRIVHISAIPTGKSPEIIYSILVEARKKNPNLSISFDPGIAFLKEKNQFLEKTMWIADYLFLNYGEFKEFGRNEDSKIAEKIFSTDQKIPDTNVIVKKNNAIIIYEHLNQRIFQKPTRTYPFPVCW